MKRHWTDDHENMIYFLSADAQDQMGIPPNDNVLDLDSILKEVRKRGLQLSLVVYKSKTPLCGSLLHQCWLAQGSPMTFTSAYKGGEGG